MTPPLPKLLTIKQAAEALSVSVPMIYKLTREQTLSVVRLGSSVRIHPEDLAALIESHRGRSAR